MLESLGSPSAPRIAAARRGGPGSGSPAAAALRLPGWVPAAGSLWGAPPRPPPPPPGSGSGTRVGSGRRGGCGLCAWPLRRPAPSRRMSWMRKDVSGLDAAGGLGPAAPASPGARCIAQARPRPLPPRRSTFAFRRPRALIAAAAPRRALIGCRRPQRAAHWSRAPAGGTRAPPARRPQDPAQIPAPRAPRPRPLARPPGWEVAPRACLPCPQATTVVRVLLAMVTLKRNALARRQVGDASLPFHLAGGNSGGGWVAAVRAPQCRAWQGGIPLSPCKKRDGRVGVNG